MSAKPIELGPGETPSAPGVYLIDGRRYSWDGSRWRNESTDPRVGGIVEVPSELDHDELVAAFGTHVSSRRREQRGVLESLELAASGLFQVALMVASFGAAFLLFQSGQPALGGLGVACGLLFLYSLLD